MNGTVILERRLSVVTASNQHCRTLNERLVVALILHFLHGTLSKTSIF